MNSLLKNFSWGSLGTVVSTIIKALTLVLLARLTAPSEFAVYAAVVGILAVGKTVADLGLTNFIMRDRALICGSHLYPHALKLIGRSSLALGIVGSFSIVAAWLAGVAISLQMMPLAVSAAFERSADTWRSVHIADGETHRRAIDLVVRRVLCLAVFSILASNEVLPPIGALAIAEVLSSLVSFVSVRRHFHRKISMPARLEVRSVLASSRPYWINSLAMSSRNLDVAVVSGIAPLTQSGYFAAAARLVGPLQVLPSNLASVLLPHVARTSGSNVGMAARLPIYTALISLPILSLLSALAPPLVPTILGEAYADGVLPIQLMILGTPLSIYSNLTISVVQGQGYAKEVARRSAIFGATMLPTVAMGAYLGDAAGAAVGTVSANLVFALMMFSVRRRVGN